MVTLVAKSPKSEELLENSERRGYHVVQGSHDARELPVSGPPRLVICCRLSGTRDEESHDKETRRTQTCWTLLAVATFWSNHV